MRIFFDSEHKRWIIRVYLGVNTVDARSNLLLLPSSVGVCSHLAMVFAPMAPRKKHVLCEKPLAIDEAKAREIVEAAKKSKKFMMEAIWSRFFPVYDHLRDALKQIGTVNEREIVALVLHFLFFSIVGHIRGMHFLCPEYGGRWNLEYSDGYWLLPRASGVDRL